MLSQPFIPFCTTSFTPPAYPHTICTYTEDREDEDAPRKTAAELGLKESSEVLADILADDEYFAKKVDDLCSCAHTKNVRRFLSLNKGMSHQTTVDPTLFAAIATAMDILTNNPDIDEDVRVRHHLGNTRKAKTLDGLGPVHSWITLQEEVYVEQPVHGTNLTLRGSYDYRLGAVHARLISSWIEQGELLCQVETLTSATCTLQLAESKQFAAIDEPESISQTVAQGIAEICRSNGRLDSFVNVLTDGRYWEFTHIRRTKDNCTKYGGKPFTYTKTHRFDIKIKRDFLVVFKLLVAAMIGNGDEFPRLAEVC
ncbi:hypothetical protein MKEN_00357200 [Mycena kentingensis (nom. inval.)]|nr:hypothetical protein MKEN_00357200 [Mycena kentingensis (nom. inval.)]